MLVGVAATGGCGATKHGDAPGATAGSGSAGAGSGGLPHGGDAGRGHAEAGSSRAGSPDEGGARGDDPLAEAGHAGSSETSTSGLALEGFNGAYARAVCEHLMGCTVTAFGALWDRLRHRDVERCTKAMLPRIVNITAPWIQGVSDGVLKYDADAAEHCVARLPALCGLALAEDPLRGFAVACQEVFDGGATPGQSCRLDIECAGSAYCSGNGGVLCGTCVERAPKGRFCAALGITCAAEGGDTAFCIDGSCRPFTVQAPTAASGETCGIDVVAGALVNCLKGTWCQPWSFGYHLGTCVAQLPPGSSCDSEDLCEDGSLCRSGKCEVVAISAPGETCPSLNCTSGSSCIEGYCVELSEEADGSRCDEFSCAAGLYCDSVSATCKALGVEGGPICFYNEECWSGRCGNPNGCISEFCSQ